MKFINKYLRNFTPYKLASHKIWTVDEESRSKMLKLDWNESTNPPSPKVSERINSIVKRGDFYNYYPSTYNQELLTLLSEYTCVPEKNIQYFASSDSLHEYVAKLYITVGDPVLVLGPSYDNFRLTAEVCGADVYFYNMENDFVFDNKMFCKIIDEKEPSLIYICNPNNPTGTQHSVSYIESMLNKYPTILFLIDEAYAEFSGITAKDLVLRYENIIISRTMSKAFGMANFRFGYLLASENNINYISSIRNPKNITTFAQEAAIGALSDIPYMKAYVKEVNKAKEMFLKGIDNFSDRIVYKKGEGNFQLLGCKTEEIKQTLIAHLEKNNIFVRDLGQTEYLRKYCIRITIGTREQMERVLQCMEDCFII
ncbi:MAG: histidinol-phosphate aminotransferase family protein [Lachnospiraceae bacterium]|jgi:histidinol-phosphate aminotransferase|nr:histidinol-phosphate aminotransferase family protein [Lachnospiraceae bacterium]